MVQIPLHERRSMRKSLYVCILSILVSMPMLQAAAAMPPGMALPDMDGSIFPEGEMPELDTNELEELTKLFFPEYDEKQRKELIDETKRLDERMRQMSPQERAEEQRKMEAELESFLQKELEAIETQEKTASQPPAPVIPPAPEKNEPTVPGKKAAIPQAAPAAIAAAKKMLKELQESITQFRLQVGSLPRVSSDTPTEQTWGRIQILINEFASYIGIVTHKDPLLNILLSDEFKLLHNQLKQLQATLKAQISQVNIPDSYKLPALDDDAMARASVVEGTTKKKSQIAVRKIVSTLAAAVEEQQIGWSLKRMIQKYAPEELKKVNPPTQQLPQGQGSSFGNAGAFGGGSYGGGGRNGVPALGGGGFGGAGMLPTSSISGGKHGSSTSGGKNSSASGFKEQTSKSDTTKEAESTEGDKGSKDGGKGKDDKKSDKDKKDGFKKPTKQLQELEKSISQLSKKITDDKVNGSLALMSQPTTDLRVLGQTIAPIAIDLKKEVESKAQKLNAEIMKAPEKEQTALYAEAYKKFMESRPLQQFEQMLHQGLATRPIAPDNLAAKPLVTAAQTLATIRTLLLDEPGKELYELQQAASLIRPRLQALPLDASQKNELAVSLNQLSTLNLLEGDVKTRSKTVKDGKRLITEVRKLTGDIITTQPPTEIEPTGETVEQRP